MRAGDLRHRVTIQRLVGTRDSYGEVQGSWTDVATVWAAVEPLRGREFLEAQMAQAAATIRVRIRYRADLTPEMRVVYGSQLLNIRAVIDVEGRHRELWLMCEEIE